MAPILEYVIKSVVLILIALGGFAALGHTGRVPRRHIDGGDGIAGDSHFEFEAILVQPPGGGSGPAGA